MGMREARTAPHIGEPGRHTNFHVLFPASSKNRLSIRGGAGLPRPTKVVPEHARPSMLLSAWMRQLSRVEGCWWRGPLQQRRHVQPRRRQPEHR